MSKQDLTVSVTQCQICNTLSIHYGHINPGSCTKCSEVSSVVNEMSVKQIEEQLLKEDARLIDMLMNPESEELDFQSDKDNIDWEARHEDLPADLRADIDAIAQSMLHSLDNAAHSGSHQLTLGNLGNLSQVDALERGSDYYFSLIPLLRSIRSSFQDDWESVVFMLEEFNGVLTKPSSHWSYQQNLELRSHNLEFKIENLNSYINELHMLGFDLIDLDEAIFCAISNKPEESWDGMDPSNRDNAICLYYGQSNDDSRLTWAHIGGSWKNSQDFLI